MEQAIKLRQLQEIYLNMLQEFHGFCVANNLTYYMVGGTLLGAVREKGFIPWDDDVDLAMPRPDYERFLRIYSGNMIVRAPKRGNKTCFPYTKLFNKSTPVVHIDDNQYQMCGDVMVQFDLYPVDGLGDDYQSAQKHVKTVSFYKWLLYLNQSADKSKNPIKNIVLALLRCLPGTVMARWIDRKMRRYCTETSAFLTRWRGDVQNGNIVPAAVFGEPVLLPFENMVLYAPADYKSYLTGVYGNYMEPEQQETGLRHDITGQPQIRRLGL